MGFEKFTKKGRGLKPVASLRSNGQLGLNRGCIERFGLHTEFVVLYYDAETRQIGIERGAGPKDDGAHQLVVKPNNAFIGVRSFLNWYGIPYEEKTRRFEINESKDDRMLVIDLRRPVTSAREVRRSPRESEESSGQGTAATGAFSE